MKTALRTGWAMAMGILSAIVALESGCSSTADGTGTGPTNGSPSATTPAGSNAGSGSCTPAPSAAAPAVPCDAYCDQAMAAGCLSGSQATKAREKCIAECNVGAKACPSEVAAGVACAMNAGFECVGGAPQIAGGACAGERKKIDGCLMTGGSAGSGGASAPGCSPAPAPVGSFGESCSCPQNADSCTGPCSTGLTCLYGKCTRKCEYASDCPSQASFCTYYPSPIAAQYCR